MPIMLPLATARRSGRQDEMAGRIRHPDLVKFFRMHQLDWNWVLLGVPEKAPQRPTLRVIRGGLR
jgi:hypothetical protein